jgi:type IV secretory pathway protease TraF
VYRDGDFVLVSTLPLLKRRLEPGDIVAFRKPPYGVMLKRVDRYNRNDGTLFVVGYHPTSVDSRRFGPLESTQVLGKVVWHIPKQ